MSMVGYLKKIVSSRRLFKINLIKTLAFNFIFFSFKEAMRLPVFVWGPLKIASTQGKIELSAPVKTGMFNLGVSDPVRSYASKSYFRLEGLLVLGDKVTIRRGMRIHIEPGATVTLEDHVFISDNNTLISKKKISIGKATVIGNNSTFMDTDFHYLMNTNTGEVKNATGEIFIGESNWIGGYCTIKKGSRTPKGTILVGPYSMIGKDYCGRIPEFCIIAGCPAKCVSEGYRMINNLERERAVLNWFEENETSFFCKSNPDKFCMPQ